ncbi:hypothetical protein Tco_0773901 [Tanacetum coccineum]|uniref:Uncharacterized protein n=1 Tax=Tanacetum coccineum TaxID=301880 RepID=A0ABQ4ZMW9_9ASTR
MTAMGKVNDRVTDLAITQRQEAQELYAVMPAAGMDPLIGYEHGVGGYYLGAQDAGNIALEAPGYGIYRLACIKTG